MEERADIKNDIIINETEKTYNDYEIIQLGGTENVKLPLNYNPLEDKGPYMNKIQKAYFKKVLVHLKNELLNRTHETIVNLTSNSNEGKCSDEGDRATEEGEKLLELRTRDRYRKYIRKIDNSILKIEMGEYGYCEQSGEPIGVQRLTIRPTTSLCIEMQKFHEKNENIKKGVKNYLEATHIDELMEE